MTKRSNNKIAIVGCAGIPASYGGFETLAENLARFHHDNKLSCQLLVFCSSRGAARPDHFLSAKLIHIGVSPNGAMSLLYDGLSLASAVLRRCDVILLLGVSGAYFLPLLRRITDAKIVTNVDGIEWKRAKWKPAARWLLKGLERVATKFSDNVIADNQGVKEYLEYEYGISPSCIAYGGDHAVISSCKDVSLYKLPKSFALALCRIEPENNPELILRSWTSATTPLVFIGNWEASKFGRQLRSKFAKKSNLILLNPIYDIEVLASIRSRVSIYIHGHSAGGTNPSLVEMMHFGVPVMAYDCVFNRYTTEGRAIYFSNATELRDAVHALGKDDAAAMGAAMKELAEDKYTWRNVGSKYFDLLGAT